MTVKARPPVGLYGYYSTGEEWLKIAVDENGKIQITSIDLTTILEEIQDSTYGLEALDTDLGTLLTRLTATRAGYLNNLSAGAVALEATLTAIKGTSWSDETLKAIKDAVDAIPTTMVGTDDAALASVLEDAMQKATSPNYSQDTDSLEAISEAIADVLIDTADIQPKVPRIVCKMDFKSLPLQVTLTSTAGDRGLVDIEVSGLPSGITIIAVEGIFFCDSVENSHDGVNYLESTKIQVKEKTTGTDRDAITLEANKIFRFTDDMVRGGTVLTADWASATAEGILAEVDGNGTYQMWFDVGETAQNNIVLDGAVFMLRIWYSV